MGLLKFFGVDKIIEAFRVYQHAGGIVPLIGQMYRFVNILYYDYMNGGGWIDQIMSNRM